jgi:hypothetical protein
LPWAEDGLDNQQPIRSASHAQRSSLEALLERWIVDRESIGNRSYPSDLLGSGLGERRARIIKQAQERNEIVTLILGPRVHTERAGLEEDRRDERRPRKRNGGLVDQNLDDFDPMQCLCPAGYLDRLELACCRRTNGAEPIGRKNVHDLAFEVEAKAALSF